MVWFGLECSPQSEILTILRNWRLKPSWVSFTRWYPALWFLNSHRLKAAELSVHKQWTPSVTERFKAQFTWTFISFISQEVVLSSARLYLKTLNPCRNTASLKLCSANRNWEKINAGPIRSCGNLFSTNSERGETVGVQWESGMAPSLECSSMADPAHVVRPHLLVNHQVDREMHNLGVKVTNPVNGYQAYKKWE